MIKELCEGITLIALIITVIVLLLLAGVAISILSGDNNIINKTGEAVAVQQLGVAQDACVVKASDILTTFYNEKHTNQAKGYNEEFLDNKIVDEICGQDKNFTNELNKLKVYAVTEEEGNQKKNFRLIYIDGSFVNGIVEYGKIIWNDYVYKGDSMIEKITADMVKYNPPEWQDWGEEEITNVQQALDYLYKN